MKNAQLILVRHGQSTYNQKNVFTGWTDVDLTDQGREEATKAGLLLKQHDLYPDICFTSWLKRAIHTGQIMLNALQWEHIDVLKSYQLNERHYGDWQGKNKDEVKQIYGEEMFLAVRRGYDVAPPPLPEADERNAWHEKKYAQLDRTQLPRHESLKETQKRVLAYYHAKIVSQLQKGKRVLISAHGNTLRALVMELEQMSPTAIVQFEILTGEILVYDFDTAMQVVQKETLVVNE